MMEVKKIMKRYKRLITLSALFIFIGLIAIRGFYIFNQEKFDTQQTIIYGYSTLAPGSPAALRILTLDHETLTPIKNANVKIKTSISRKKNLTF
jgi:hypothetical protein